jgi:hypothetical protein
MSLYQSASLSVPRITRNPRADVSCTTKPNGSGFVKKIVAASPHSGMLTHDALNPAGHAGVHRKWRQLCGLPCCSHWQYWS